MRQMAYLTLWITLVLIIVPSHILLPVVAITCTKLGSDPFPASAIPSTFSTWATQTASIQAYFAGRYNFTAGHSALSQLLSQLQHHPSKLDTVALPIFVHVDDIDRMLPGLSSDPAVATYRSLPRLGPALVVAMRTGVADSLLAVDEDSTRNTVAGVYNAALAEWRWWLEQRTAQVQQVNSAPVRVFRRGTGGATSESLPEPTVALVSHPWETTDLSMPVPGIAASAAPCNTSAQQALQAASPVALRDSLCLMACQSAGATGLLQAGASPTAGCPATWAVASVEATAAMLLQSLALAELSTWMMYPADTAAEFGGATPAQWAERFAEGLLALSTQQSALGSPGASLSNAALLSSSTIGMDALASAASGGGVDLQRVTSLPRLSGLHILAGSAADGPYQDVQLTPNGSSEAAPTWQAGAVLAAMQPPWLAWPGPALQACPAGGCADLSSVLGNGTVWVPAAASVLAALDYADLQLSLAQTILATPKAALAGNLIAAWHTAGQASMGMHGSTAAALNSSVLPWAWPSIGPALIGALRCAGPVTALPEAFPNLNAYLTVIAVELFIVLVVSVFCVFAGVKAIANTKNDEQLQAIIASSQQSPPQPREDQEADQPTGMLSRWTSMRRRKLGTGAEAAPDDDSVAFDSSFSKRTSMSMSRRGSTSGGLWSYLLHPITSLFSYPQSAAPAPAPAALGGPARDRSDGSDGNALSARGQAVPTRRGQPIHTAEV